MCPCTNVNKSLTKVQKKPDLPTVWLLNDGTKNFQTGPFIFKIAQACSAARAIQSFVSIVKFGDNLAILSTVENRRHCGDFLREKAKFQ